jgi:hypothetical protein
VNVEGNWVPGKRITDRQVNEYKRYRLVSSQETAAAKAGMSVRTARRVERATALPSQRVHGEHARIRWRRYGRARWCRCSSATRY